MYSRIERVTFAVLDVPPILSWLPQFVWMRLVFVEVSSLTGLFQTLEPGSYIKALYHI